MSQPQSKRLKIAGVWIAILLLGAVAGWLTQRNRRAVMLAELLDDAKRSAVAFDPAEMRALSGTRSDIDSPVYAAVTQRLRKMQAVDERLRFVYIVRSDPAVGKVVLVADSATPGAADGPQAGEPYPQARELPGLQEIIRTGAPATEELRTDRHGTWMTGYALIAEAHPPDGREPVKDILGVDVAAAHWRRKLWQSAFQGAFYVWILLGLPFVGRLVRRRQGEQREVIRNLSEAMEQSHSAILILDLEGRIEYANRGLTEQIGYLRRELIGRRWREFQLEGGSHDAVAEMEATMRAGRTWDGEWHNQHKNGTVYPVRGVVTPVKHRDGTLACYVAVFDDVTETKRKEAELREARDLAQAGDRAKGQFLATMSHEVRTPLNGIVGFTSLLLETPLTSEQREYVQTIRVSTEALIQLTGDILDFARIESGKLKLEPLACDPRECVEDALDLLAAKAAEKNLELLHRVADDVPSAIVADGGRLRQIVVNLVGNALKFTERGEVEVSLRVLPSTVARRGSESPIPTTLETDINGSTAQQECLLEISVRDTGIGIASDDLSKLFKPFSQVDESTTRRYGGTGLGLAICRNLVHLMGGEINVVSEPNYGSTFSFTMRVPVAAPLPPQRDLNGLRVGVCMRDGALRREMLRLLTSWRARPVATERPDQLPESGWDIAIVEIEEPFARELAGRAEPIPTLPPEKVVALVPVTLSNDLRAALRSHCRLLVNKPVHHGALFALLTGARPDAKHAAVPATHFGFRVLVVDDDTSDQRFIKRVLTNVGCTWRVVETGREAVEELNVRPSDYDLMLLDLHRPELEGMAALQAIRMGKAGPRPQTMWIIAVTADPEEERGRTIAAGLNDCLGLPLKVEAVEAALRRFRSARGMRRR